MQPFTTIGQTIKERWQAQAYDEQAFPEIAADVLRTGLPVGTIDLDDVLTWVQTNPALVTQVEHEFGKPITVHHDGRFYIDVLTWIDGTTEIHEHGFAGAFTVLRGSSLHSRYAFHREQRLSERLYLGSVELLEVERLEVGDVRPIYPGARSAHALFHLDRPSLSVVVRTLRDTTTGVQLCYQRAGLAFDPFHKETESERLLRSLTIMRMIDHPELVARTRELADRQDPFTAFKIARHLSRIAPRETYLALLEQPPPRHRALYGRLLAAADEERRERNIVARRHAVRREPHRFFLALLLNLRGRDEILQMVATRYPERDPIDTVMAWVEELAAEPAVDGGEPNAIGIELDELSLLLMRRLLEGLADDEAIDRLAEAYDGVEESRGDLRALCAAFRESILFARLFASGTPQRPPAARRAG
jgi:hypothetical protein